MKKPIVTIAAAIITVCALLFTATAANFTHVADSLNELGLFDGTGDGYALDRAPNRAEALVMMLRLMGLRDEAENSSYEHPFEDVRGHWSEPYVAFAYQHGYTTGVTPTTFNPTGLSSAQMYVTFVLRALGYGDDFNFENAIEFGTEIGVIDAVLASGTFLRDQMVAVSYLALATAPKDSEFDTLLEKLLDAGAVDADAAANILQKFALIEEFNNLEADLDFSAIEMNMKLEMVMSVLFGMPGMTMSMDMGISIDANVTMIVGEDDITAAIAGEISLMGEEITAEIYIVDGYIYINAEGEKIKMPLDAMGIDMAALIDIINMMDVMDMAELEQFAHIPIYAYRSISKVEAGGLTVWTVEIVDGMLDAMMDQVLDIMDEVPGMETADDISIRDFLVVMHIDADGTLRRMIMEMSMSMADEVGNMTMEIKIDIEVIALGDDVVVNLPDDLDEYILLDLGALLPLI